jgi:translation elongation factor EF-Tu-like GTPase
MNHLPRIEAEITFLPECKGGRKQPPLDLSGGSYRPHVVVEDLNQPRATTVENLSQETYLGVSVVSGLKEVKSGEPFYVELVLIYWPLLTYESLTPGATFTLREGAKIVGHGQVRRVIAEGSITNA